MKYLILQTCRNGYDATQAEDCATALTVRELIDVLNQYDKDLKVYFDNDNGYTYGSVTFKKAKKNKGMPKHTFKE